MRDWSGALHTQPERCCGLEPEWVKQGGAPHTFHTFACATDEIIDHTRSPSPRPNTRLASSLLETGSRVAMVGVLLVSVPYVTILHSTHCSLCPASQPLTCHVGLIGLLIVNVIFRVAPGNVFFLAKLRLLRR